IELALLGFDAGGHPSSNSEEPLRRAIAIDPSFAPAYLALADFLRSRGRDDDGASVLAAGIARASEVAPLEHALGLSLVRRGDRAGALVHLGRAHELAPRTVQW